MFRLRCWYISAADLGERSGIARRFPIGFPLEPVYVQVVFGALTFGRRLSRQAFKVTFGRSPNMGESDRGVRCGRTHSFISYNIFIRQADPGAPQGSPDVPGTPPGEPGVPWGPSEDPLRF